MNKTKRVLSLLLPVAFWLGLWVFAAWQVGQELLLPHPWSVITRLGELVITPLFWQTALASLVRIFVGMLVGVLVGVLGATATHFSTLCRLIFTPGMQVVRATPVASFIILLLLWFPAGRVPGVAAALMVIPVLWGHVAQGLSQTDPQLLELTRAYRFSPLKTFTLLYLPSVRPSFLAGMQTALGLAWKAGIAAEVLCQPKLAVGTQIYRAKLGLASPDLFAWTILVVALSFLLERLLSYALKGGKHHAPNH